MSSLANLVLQEIDAIVIRLIFYVAHKLAVLAFKYDNCALILMLEEILIAAYFLASLGFVDTRESYLRE